VTEGYGSAALDYWRMGWRSILPVPHKKKFPPPNGYTGYNATIPSYPDIMAWAEDYPDHNLALRMPAEVIGIDVDAYGDKVGASTFDEAVRRWGDLPDTIRSTSREDPYSGIRLYRKPADVSLHTQIKFPGVASGNIEIVQDHHRYCMSWPSLHPEGRVYEWRDDNGNAVEIPAIEDLPLLPQRWVDGLRAVSATEITDTRDPYEALKELPQGPMTVRVEQALQKAVRDLECAPGSRHDVCNARVLGLLRMGEKGERGVVLALQKLQEAFIRATRDRNTRSEAEGEFKRMVFGQRGHDLIASTPSKENDYATLLGQSYQAPIDRPSGGIPAPVIVAAEDPHVVGSAVGSYAIEPEPDPVIDALSQLAEALGARQLPNYGKEFSLDGSDHEDHGAVEQMYGSESPTGMRDKLLTVEGLGRMQPALPMIDGLLYQNTLAQLSGEPGSGKTFITLGMACAVASNKGDWNGRTVAGHGPVLYVAAEGSSGLHSRILAWCEQQQYDSGNLRLFVYPEAVQLGSYEQVQELCQLVIDLDVALVVLDTRARCTVDLEENSATEQGRAIAAAEAIRASRDCTVLCVHHGSRSNGSTPRGSNAWDGAVWSDLRIKTEGMKEGQVAVKVHKHKDAPGDFDVPFELMPWTVSTELMPGRDERVRSTLVAVTPDERPDKPGSDSKANKEVIEYLKSAATPGDGRSAREITDALGCSRQKVDKSLTGLFLTDRVVRTKEHGANRYWLRPDLEVT
jgi:hypothetical protein